MPLLWRTHLKAAVFTIILPLAFNLASASANETRHQTQSVPDLHSVKPDDAIDDAKRQFRAGDYRLWAFSGFGIRTPGLPEGCQITPVFRRVAKGFSDALTPSQMRAGGSARTYAKQYNQTMIELTRAGDISVCRGERTKSKR